MKYGKRGELPFLKFDDASCFGSLDEGTVARRTGNEITISTAVTIAVGSGGILGVEFEVREISG